jgi:hypothetical protein
MNHSATEQWVSPISDDLVCDLTMTVGEPRTLRAVRALAPEQVSLFIDDFMAHSRKAMTAAVMSARAVE